MRKIWLLMAGHVLAVVAAPMFSVVSYATGDAAQLAAVQLISYPQPYFGPLDRDDPAYRDHQLWAMAIGVSDHGPCDAKFDHNVFRDGEGESSTSILDVACDSGAREGLSLHPDKSYWYEVAYFASQQEAFAYQEGYGISVVGIVPVFADWCGSSG